MQITTLTDTNYPAAVTSYAVVSDEDSVGRLIDDTHIAIDKATTGDLAAAIDWLASYTGGIYDTTSQELANVIGFLEQEIAKRKRASAVAAAKRAYAAEHGVPVSKLRLAK